MIERVIFLLLAGLASCVLTLILTPLIRRVMVGIGAVDKPDARRINCVPIPRGGGLAVVIAYFLVMTVVSLFWPEVAAQAPINAFNPWFAGAAVIMVGAGLVDDVRGIAPIVKLLAQIAAALVLCFGGIHLSLPESWGSWTQSAWAVYPMTVAWYIGVVNAFNLIDGLDGLSSGLAIIAAAGLVGVMFVLSPTAFPLRSLIFMGALIGFLRYNYNPASVFLGDSGSLFVGLFLATQSLAIGRPDAFLVTVGIPVLCLGIPLMDTVLAILRRTLRYILIRRNGGADAGSVMTADRSHLHHRFLDIVHGQQRKAVWCLYGLAILLVAVGFLTLVARDGKASVFLVGFLAVAAVIVRMMSNVELWDAGDLMNKPGTRNGRKFIALPLYMFGDSFIMGLIYAFLWFLLGPMLPDMPLSARMNILLMWSVPVMVALVAVGGYTRIWGRSNRRDSFLVLLAIAGGALASRLGMLWFRPETARALTELHLLWALLLMLPCLVLRLAKTAFLQFLARAENRILRNRTDDPSVERVLFYGAGVCLRGYLTLFETNVTHNRDACLAVLDDNRGLRGRIFRGLRVVGPLEVLEDKRVYARYRPTKIVVTSPAICGERLEEIRAFCRVRGLKMTRFVAEEVSIG